MSKTSTALALIMPLTIAIAIWQVMAVVILGLILLTAIALKATGGIVGAFAIDGTPNLLDLNIFLLGTTVVA